MFKSHGVYLQFTGNTIPEIYKNAQNKVGQKSVWQGEFNYIKQCLHPCKNFPNLGGNKIFDTICYNAVTIVKCINEFITRKQG